ncbi:MAG: DNA topoisomerase 3 [Marinilabiliaceae bacterium]|nr:DNA topoisomerase 3 [Marinilabiliaceae bacterium]
MKVCIAEKPSVAAEIANVIGAKKRCDGYYEGNNYRVTWTFGHLCTLKEPHDYLPGWKKWSLGTLPIIPSRFGIKLITNKGVEKQFRIIANIVKEAEEVINCGDAGQEGELIQRWVLLKAGCSCPVKRLWISSLTEEAIEEGFKALRDADDFKKLYAAGSSRAIGDWLLGINATRLYTLKFGQQGQVLSIGRVQTPTLALIVERHKAIESFIPEPFWEIKTTYRDVVFSASSGRFQNKEDAVNAAEKINNKPFTVTDYSIKEGIESAPRLFDLTSLQVECNKKIGLSADETLKTIQQLYEKKLTTYPRVDTTYLSDDIYPKIPKILKGITVYQDLTLPLLDKKIRKSKKVFDNSKVTDHHAIIPTGVNPGKELSRDEKLVYDMVARRFIANFYPDSKISTTSVEGEVDGVKFKTSGKQILEPAWRVVFAQQKDNTEDKILPIFEKGETGSHIPDLQEKMTQPPKPYTEATLLRAMETAGKQVDDEEMRDLMKDNGIGRPSTRAAVIETLFKRKYISKVKKNLHPTVTGIQLVDSIGNELLKSVELTGLWEKKLREIEKGDYSAETFMGELKQMVWEVVNQVKYEQNVKKIEVVGEVDSHVKKETPVKKDRNDVETLLCPVCKKGAILKGSKAWGCSEYNNGCKTVIPFSIYNKKITDTQLKQLLKTGKTRVVKGVEIEGIKQDGIFVFNESNKVVFEPSKPDIIICPKCKKGEILTGKTAFGCGNFKQGCDFRLPFNIDGIVIDYSIANELITKGSVKVNKIQADGSVINVNLSLNEQYQIQLDR